MKNDIKEYKGLSKEDEKYLREFDNATERGFFKDKLVKLTDKQKSEIQRERDKFKVDLMVAGKRGGGEIDQMLLDKPYIGKRKVVDQARDDSGKFKKKDKK